VAGEPDGGYDQQPPNVVLPMTAMSRAAVFHGAGKPLELATFPLPSLRSDEVLVEILCSTLCASDLHTYAGRRPAPVPSILGHEIIGRVVAHGGTIGTFDDARPLELGERITWTVAASCGRCFYCRHELPQKCETLFKYGHEPLERGCPLSGGLAEHCLLVEGTAILRVPAELPEASAAPANCATATVAAALRYAHLRGGESVLVQGAGMLGLTACAMASRAGASAVMVGDVDAKRLERAARFGATDTVLLAESSDALEQTVREQTAGRGVDVAFELSGSPAAIETGLGLLRTGGVYIWVGSVMPTRAISLSPETIVRRMLRIHGVHNYAAADLAVALRFLAETHTVYPFAELVGTTYPLEAAEAAFAAAARGDCLRVAVRPRP